MFLKRPVNERVVIAFHYAGFLFIISLMIFVLGSGIFFTLLDVRAECRTGRRQTGARGARNRPISRGGGSLVLPPMAATRLRKPRRFRYCPPLLEPVAFAPRKPADPKTGRCRSYGAPGRTDATAAGPYRAKGLSMAATLAELAILVEGRLVGQIVVSTDSDEYFS